MPQVARPALTSPRDSFLRKEHFQIAYVTNDIARARDTLASRYGIANYHNVEGEMPTGGGYMRVALAWAGGTMYELIQAEGPNAAFYHNRLTSRDFQMRHHHFGYLIGDLGEWTALERKIAQEKWKVAFSVETAGFMRAIYIEAPELDHYLEYIFPEPAGAQFLENIPNN
jgi:hypothetical protein